MARQRAGIAVPGGPMVWVSNRTTAPGATAVQSDTGQLPAGEYDFDIMLAVSDTVTPGKGLIVEHRNANQTATLQRLGGATPNGGAIQLKIRRYVIATNERVRVITGFIAGAVDSMYLSTIGRRRSPQS